MRERPILMNAAMVRAVLEGRKTQTRRPVKQAVHPHGDQQSYAIYPDGSGSGWVAWFGAGGMTAEKTASLYPGGEGFKCPYGQPGARLWVRETFAIATGGKGLKAAVRYAADGALRAVESDVDATIRYGINASTSDRWRPSIHMPRWASRITLEITEVRVERVQDISTEDARAEGITEYLSEIATKRHTEEDADIWRNRTTIENFRNLWDSIYYPGIYKKPTPFKWDANPWVWVVEFRRIEP